jgi:hypothetical protein
MGEARPTGQKYRAKIKPFQIFCPIWPNLHAKSPIAEEKEARKGLPRPASFGGIMSFNLRKLEAEGSRRTRPKHGVYAYLDKHHLPSGRAWKRRDMALHSVLSGQFISYANLVRLNLEAAARLASRGQAEPVPTPFRLRPRSTRRRRIQACWTRGKPRRTRTTHSGASVRAETARAARTGSPGRRMKRDAGGTC